MEQNDIFYKSSKDDNHNTMLLAVIVTIIFLTLTLFLAFVFFKNRSTDENVQNKIETDEQGVGAKISPTPTPVTELNLNQNVLLYPASNVKEQQISTVGDDVDPKKRGIVQIAFNKDGEVKDFERNEPISFKDPLFYGSVPGIFTYRGNNYRNTATFGYTDVSIGNLKQKWEFSGIGSKTASTQTYEWQGVTLTGQPLVIKWDSNVRRSMHLNSDKASKENFTEVIVAGLDGKIYFFDMDDGTPSRKPINVGATIKGTPALDPRGYPLLYIGQGDDNADNGKFGIYIYSLINDTCIYSYDAKNDRSYRENWSAFDSSPLVNAETDTLLWPGENGIIYTFKLNTSYSLGAAGISVNPEVLSYKYMYMDENGRRMGIESSMAVYDGYGYFCDNDLNLNCIDLNTMKMKWYLKLRDNTDISPVIDIEDDVPYIYVGTEVDSQNGVGDSYGAAFIYKVNGITGEIEWQTSEACYTHKATTSDNNQTGGCLGNIICGKKSISNLVIYSFSMTKGINVGNELVAYDKEKGTVVWKYEMNVFSYSSPVDCYDKDGNAYIIICDSYGQIHMIDGATGKGRNDDEKRIASIQVKHTSSGQEDSKNIVSFEASPVVFENTLIVSSKAGSVFAIEIG